MTKTLNKVVAKLQSARKAIVPFVATVVGLVSLHYGASAPQTTALVGLVEVLGVYTVPNSKS